MIKLPTDQKYQLSYRPVGINKASNLSLQEAVDCRLGTVEPYCPPSIHLDGEPSKTITIKEEPIHDLTISFRKHNKEIFIGDIQDGITVTFKPQLTTAQLTISKRSVFLNGEQVEFISDIKAPFKVGDIVRLTKKRLSEGKGQQPREGKITIIHNDGGICFTHKEGQACCFNPENLELVPTPSKEWIHSHNLRTEPTLFYIVRKGTNARFNDSAIQSYALQGPGFLIVDSENIEQELQEINNSFEGTFEAISISDYEQKYSLLCTRINEGNHLGTQC